MRETLSGFRPRTLAKTAIVTAIGLALFGAPVLAAGSDPTLPTSVTHAGQLSQLDAVAEVTAPSVDLQSVQLEDVQRDLAGLAPRYAIPNATSITPATHGDWEEVDAETMVWRLRVRSVGAVSLNLGFTRYAMPKGGRLLIYATDLTNTLRPFTAGDNATHGELWTPPIPADDIVLEVTLPKANRPGLDLELSFINVGYRDFLDGSDSTRSGSCNVDVVCPQGDAWRDEIPSAGAISTGGSLFCSGGMLNNTAQDGTPYFLTANHCGINSSNAASLVVFWNFETSTCGGTPDGSLNDFQTGSFFRASSSASDFTLVELDEAPDPAWGVTFAGWNRSGAEATSAVAIHHPSVDEKRISFEDQPTTTTSYLDNAVPGNGTHVRVADWDLGTTEGGSSGSHLFNQNHQVIGQLHGGYAACGNDSSDWYGKFSVSWTGGGTSSTRLSDWLDPGNTGAISVNTLVSDPMGGCCSGASCAIATQVDCQAGGGSYLGDGSDCSSSGAGTPTSYSATVNQAIPDNGGSGNPTTHTINVADTFTVGDVNVDVGISHTYVGDVTVTVSHGGTTVSIVDRPGYTGSGFGCSNDNMNVNLDDEGAGGAIESQCVANLSSPPSYTPNQALSAFDGMNVSGDWTISVSDSASQDTGTLDSWGLQIDQPGAGPCAAGCTVDADCDDGAACNGLETCTGGNCQPGTPVDCNDSNLCTADSCDDGSGACSNVAISCDDSNLCTADSCDPGTGCSNTATDCNDANACTMDGCDPLTGLCFSDPVNCDDGDACTVDSCDSVLGCDNTPAACGIADGCCNAGCDAGNDPDCNVCLPKNASCSVNADCCSNKCRGRSGRKTCK